MTVKKEETKTRHIPTSQLQIGMRVFRRDDGKEVRITDIQNGIYRGHYTVYLSDGSNTQVAVTSLVEVVDK